MKECPSGQISDPVECYETNFMTSASGRDYYYGCQFWINEVPSSSDDIEATPVCS